MQALGLSGGKSNYLVIMPQSTTLGAPLNGEILDKLLGIKPD